MTLLQLQYFQTLARVLHYTRAAEELHISQPSLSYAISELGKELGISLFEKRDRKVLLSPYGQAFLPYVDKALSVLEEGKTTLSQMIGDKPQIVRIGYFHSISASLIPVIVEQFYKNPDNAGIRFQFMEAPSFEVFSALQTGELDFAFTLHNNDWAQSLPILRQPLYLAVSSDHPLASKSSVVFDDFSQEPQIVLEKSSNLRMQFDNIYAKHECIPNIVFEVFECNAALQYVALRMGVAVLPQVPAMDSERVAVLPIADQNKEFVRTVYFSWDQSQPTSQAAGLLRDYIKEHYVLPN